MTILVKKHYLLIVYFVYIQNHMYFYFLKIKDNSKIKELIIYNQINYLSMNLIGH